MQSPGTISSISLWCDGNSPQTSLRRREVLFNSGTAQVTPGGRDAGGGVGISGKAQASAASVSHPASFPPYDQDHNPANWMRLPSAFAGHYPGTWRFDANRIGTPGGPGPPSGPHLLIDGTMPPTSRGPIKRFNCSIALDFVLKDYCVETYRGRSGAANGRRESTPIRLLHTLHVVTARGDPWPWVV